MGLDAIKDVLQSSVIEANVSDEGIALHLRKLRESMLPTEEELKLWPKARSELESEKLRAKARELFQEKAMPQALTSIMGAASSQDALGKVFDALQIRDVSRGLVFALMIQAARIVVH